MERRRGVIVWWDGGEKRRGVSECVERRRGVIGWREKRSDWVEGWWRGGEE